MVHYVINSLREMIFFSLQVKNPSVQATLLALLCSGDPADDQFFLSRCIIFHIASYPSIKLTIYNSTFNGQSLTFFTMHAQWWWWCVKFCELRICKYFYIGAIDCIAFICCKQVPLMALGMALTDNSVAYPKPMINRVKNIIRAHVTFKCEL